MTCASNIKAKSVEFCISNFAPFAINVKLSAGSSTITFQVPKHSSQSVYKLPMQNWDGKITIASKTWWPARVLRNGDKRELGVAVHYFRFVD